MERTVLLVFLCSAIESLVVKKNFFISKSMDWYGAQAHCRQHYTDLSFVESLEDQDDLHIAAGGTSARGWIGLNRDIQNVTGWRWSGGQEVGFTNWDVEQPDNRDGNQTAALLAATAKWHDISPTSLTPFYCVHLTVLEENVTEPWEEALEHCKENKGRLISVSSETKLNQTLQLVQQVSTGRVWVGLRYLGSGWLWLSGDPVEEQAWSAGAGQDQQCPEKNRCGALSREGRWEARDCQEKLSFICD